MNHFKFLKIKALTFLLALAATAANAQINPTDFTFNLEPIAVSGLPGLQSYAVGEIDGKYLIVGGRTDGLHRRQPFATFDAAGKNGSVWLLDPATGQVWSKSLAGLPTSVVEQLASTNMEFWQDGPTLFCIGGYGYAPSAGDHITFPFLTAIDLAGAAQAIQSGNPLAGHIRQSAADERIRVTGGYLGKLGAELYLAGGQKFMGRYNPMGPTQGPGFVQVYSDEIRRFKITDDGTAVGISNYSAWHDTLNLHRRDYNMVPQVFPDGRRGFTMFSGVFQHAVDLPWLNTVDFDSSGFTVNNQFSQLLNQYHTAHLPIFEAGANAMHTVFFGGIARYFIDPANGLLVQDDDVPFVRTISRSTRLADGSMDEVKIGEMPALLGASGEFLPLPGAAFFENLILNLDDLPGDSTHVGYILGGIRSTAPNIFFVNDGTQSEASNILYKVWLVRKQAVPTVFPEKTATVLNLRAMPNPTTGDVTLSFELDKKRDLMLQVVNTAGRVVLETPTLELPVGEHKMLVNLGFLPRGIYHAVLRDGSGVLGWVRLGRS